MQRRLLVIDDDPVDREAVQRMVRNACDVISAGSGAEALAILPRVAPDAILLDYHLPDADGLSVLIEMVARDLAPVIMMTGHGSESVAVEAMKLGARDYLVKSDISARALLRSVDYAVERFRLEHQVSEQQSQLRESELRARIILDQLPAVVWMTDGALRYESVAGGAWTALGADARDLIGRDARQHPIDLRGDPAALEALEDALAGHSGRYELRAGDRVFEAYVEPRRRLPGRGPDMPALAMQPAGVVGFALDVTERNRLEEQFLQSQRLEAVGRLAGGVAHDFNNLLTVIMSFTQLALQRLEVSHPVRGDLEQITEAARRAAELTRQLLAFSRQEVITPRVLSLNELLADTTRMLLRLLGEDIELVLDGAPQLWDVEIDAGMLHQVIVNLAVNARDAMPGGGVLRLETHNEQLAEAHACSQGDPIPPGDYAVIVVSDTGEGMSREVQQRIFEPFFTTKSHGSGLGLATSYGIVRQAGGFITLDSAPGRGTAFRIYLPRARRARDSRPDRPSPRLHRGSETVLVVEDARSVRSLVARVLRGCGYRLLVADSGDEALALAAKHDGEIHLLLTDVVMPRVGGEELARRLREDRPGLRVLFMSGHTRGALRRDDGSANERLISKPFTPDALARAVRDALDDDRC